MKPLSITPYACNHVALEGEKVRLDVYDNDRGGIFIRLENNVTIKITPDLRVTVWEGGLKKVVASYTQHKPELGSQLMQEKPCGLMPGTLR